MAIKVAEVATYLIGLGIVLLVLFTEEFKIYLPDNKVLGFPVRKIGYPFIIYFCIMILWAFVG